MIGENQYGRRRTDSGTGCLTQRTNPTSSPVTEANRGDILVKLKKNRKRSVDEITEDIRSQVNAQEPAVRAECVRELQDMIGDLTSETEPMQLKLFSPDGAAPEQWATGNPGSSERRSGPPSRKRMLQSATSCTSATCSAALKNPLLST
jgi:hypothetical protein